MPEDNKNENSLLDQIDDLEGNNDDVTDDEVVIEDEPEETIVDLFVKGDMDSVKARIHDQVVKTVSDFVNGNSEDSENDIQGSEEE